MPGGQAGDVHMLDVETLDEPEGDEETEKLPSLNVKIEEVVEEEPQQALHDQQEMKALCKERYHQRFQDTPVNWRDLSFHQQGMLLSVIATS